MLQFIIHFSTVTETDKTFVYLLDFSNKELIIPDRWARHVEKCCNFLAISTYFCAKYLLKKIFVITVDYITTLVYNLYHLSQKSAIVTSAVEMI